MKVWDWDVDGDDPPSPWLVFHPATIADILADPQAVELYEKMFPGVIIVPTQKTKAA